MSHSGGILEALGGLLEKTEGQLDALRKQETSAQHNFAVLDQAAATLDAAMARATGLRQKEKAESKSWCGTEHATDEATSKERTEAVETLHAILRQKEQVLAGLRQDIRSALRRVKDMNAAYLAPRAVHRVVGTLLKSISDGARGNRKQADSQRFRSILVMIAETPASCSGFCRSAPPRRQRRRGCHRPLRRTSERTRPLHWCLLLPSGTPPQS